MLRCIQKTKRFQERHRGAGSTATFFRSFCVRASAHDIYGVARPNLAVGKRETQNSLEFLEGSGVREAGRRIRAVGGRAVAEVEGVVDPDVAVDDELVEFVGRAVRDVVGDR